MVKHVVIWKLKESALGKSKKENLDTMKKMLEDMRPKIKEIREMEIGLNIEINLPNKEIYQVIKNNYPDEWQDKFIEKIVNDISLDELKNSMIKSLKEFYDVKNEDDKNI